MIETTNLGSTERTFVLDVAKPPRKIAIVGKAPSSSSLAPYEDESWEIWVLGDSALHPEFKRYSRTFELHDLDNGFARWIPQYQEFLKTDQGKPLYIQAAHPDVPHGTPYPRREIKAKYGPLLHNETGEQVHYFTNTISWMIALALYEGATEIGLWGVDMAQHGEGLLSEYAHQRPSCELWVGVAIGMGVAVTIHSASDLCKTPCDYGFNPAPNSMRLKHKARSGDLKKGKTKAIQQANEATFNLRRLKSHREYWQGRLLGVIGTDEASEKVREELVEKIAQLSAAIENADDQRQEFVQKICAYSGGEESQMYWGQHIFG